MNNRIKSNLDYYYRRYVINPKNRAKLRAKDFSVISSNCIGGVMLHDLGLRFDSPFVNLWLSISDYNKMLANLRDYLKIPLKFVKSDYDYPVAKLEDVYVHFQHYTSEDEARNKWNIRLNRIHWDNLFILCTDIDASFDEIKRFNELTYKNKVIFCHRPLTDIDSSYYISGREDLDNVGILTDYRPDKIGRRYLDEFDYVGWLNSSFINERL